MTDGRVDNALSVADLYRKMTVRERRFWEAYSGPCKMNATDAYLSISPGVTHKTAKANGSRMLGLIREKAGGREGLLEMFGLGLDRAFYEIDARLRAVRVETYQGAIITDPKTNEPMEFEDNGTRMQATKLLAELHGLRKQIVDLNVNDRLTPEERRARMAALQARLDAERHADGS